MRTLLATDCLESFGGFPPFLFFLFLKEIGFVVANPGITRCKVLAPSAQSCYIRHYTNTEQSANTFRAELHHQRSKVSRER